MHRPLASLLFVAVLAPLPAQDAPMSLPVQASATVDAAALATTGTATVRFTFLCEEVLDRAYAVRVEIRRGGRVVLRRDHAPPVPTKQWAKNKPVEYSLPLVFRTAPEGVQAGDSLDVAIGFHDAAADRVAPPLARKVGGDGMVVLAT
ncbi:MAG: hypothetical protein JNK15_19225, partial [Planctomycetes bacterium]|nr:hypothetical protein [Planctomycetota bacterium]